MSIKITNGGMLSTIQDAGRTGAQSTGFSVSGVMDCDAYRDANHLVGNINGEAAIEMTYNGICAEFLCDAVIAFTGGNFSPRINGLSVPSYHSVSVKRGDILKMGMTMDSMRCYMAVKGGFDVPVIMGSRSTNMKIKIGGFEGRKLKTGDIIPIGHGITEPVRDRFLPKPEYNNEIRVILGPQDKYFTQKGIDTFLSCEYTVSDKSDRMGYRFDGAEIENNGTDIISDGIAQGSIQISSNGQPIIMMADRQTTGGYAKIATVISVDIPKLAQKKPGEKVKFTAVTLKEAQKEYIKKEKYYRTLFLED